MSRAARHASRQVALQVLYAADLATRPRPGEDAVTRMPPAAEEVFESVAENFDLPEAARAFAKQLVCGVTRRRDELDALLAQHARNWRISRMAAVDRNVLRIAVYELLRTDTPTSVILDQAIELARRFGDEPSPAFVNGVLDAVAHAVERPATLIGGQVCTEELE
ncbi:MAG: transcription antitermination factor NusB [Deltaproteobacteria bacterium]|nr:transcription antitermination factor NusB [Deltaproteobacteria bacterium]